MYLFALVTIAITVLLSQVLIQQNLSKQLSDSRIINISGKQRMLSQKMTKELLELNIIVDSLEQKAKIKQIAQTIQQWKRNHYWLQNGNKSLGFPTEKKQPLLSYYEELSTVFENLLGACTQYIANKKQHLNPVENKKLLQRILKNETIFLSKMNRIVGQYEKEALQKVKRQSNTEYGLLAFTLLVLLLEFIFIFRPTNKKVERLIRTLSESEKNATKLAEDTLLISQAKEESVKELKSLNYAMENTLLYCRVAPDGSIIHIGDKFSKLIQYNPLQKEKSFGHALSPIEKEQLFIDRLLAENNRRGWQGEIKISSRTQQELWLELSIVPVSIKQNASELLIISFDISERKKAQQEVERLNTANIADKLNQQKVISSKIVDNQENEQNRIAREIHDGIGQMLTGLKYSLESINLEDAEKTKTKIDYLKQLTLDIIKGVRTATFNLMPPELSDHGLSSALSKLCLELSKLTGKNILFYNKSDFNSRLDSLIEINIYRLTQEAVNNAIKYAESTHIIVQLSHSASLLSITVDDNGKGFDLTAVEKKRNSESGMGMLFMKERIEYINGRLFFNSIPNEGTRITFNVPI